MLLYSAFNLPEDHQHFHLFTNGDERGLSYLEKRLSRYIFSYAYKIIANSFEINSIVQDAYIKAWNYRTNFHDIPHLVNYLKRSAKWACYDCIRKNKDHLTISIEHYDYQLTNTDDSIAEAEQRISKESRWDMLEEAITYLPSDKRAIVELWKDGLSYDSIAKTQNTTHQQITAEIKKIEDHLKRINSRLVKAALAESKRPLLMLSDYRIYLNRQQCSIFKHYYEEARSLSQIAILLDITPFQLQQQLLYIKHIIDNKPQIK